MLSLISSLQILDTNPLLDMSFGNIFSHSVGCLLVLLIVSCVVHFSHSDRCVLLSPHGFDMHFPDDE